MCSISRNNLQNTLCSSHGGRSRTSTMSNHLKITIVMPFFSVLIGAWACYQVQANKSWKGIWWGDFSKDFLTPKKFSLVARLVKNPPAMQETKVWALSCEDPLEKELATHSRIPWTEELGGLNPWGHKESDMTEWLTFPVFLPRKSHGQRSLASSSPWGHKSWTWLRWNHWNRITRMRQSFSSPDIIPGYNICS